MRYVPKYSSILQKISDLTGYRGELYLVGGTVRDMLLLREVKDFDFAGDFDPQGMGEEFVRVSHGSLVSVGERFGTVRVVTREGVFDFSSFRGESLSHDLGDRDISINAMAYPLGVYLREGFRDEGVVDPHRGMDDLKKRIVRALSEENFLADPARLLRVYRFASELGFSIEGKTERLIRTHAGSVKEVKGERVRDEIFSAIRGGFFRLVAGKKNFIRLLSECTGIEIDDRAARKRVIRLLDRAGSSKYLGIREALLAELSGGRRAIDNLILLSYCWGEGMDSVPDTLFETLRLSRRERDFAKRINRGMKRGVFPPRGICPVNPEAAYDSGSCFPHFILFADGFGAFGRKRNIVEKSLTYYFEYKNTIEKKVMPWSAEKALSFYLKNGGKHPKRIIRELSIETLAGKVRNDDEGIECIDTILKRKENG